MMIFRMHAAAPLVAAALAFSPAAAFAGGGPETPDRGAGASGQGDGSGMGQDNTESGKPKGPGDKPTPAASDKKDPAEGPVSPAKCDDGSQPSHGACPG